APIQCHIYTDLRNKVRKRVEKNFFDTPEMATTIDISTFIEGGLYLHLIGPGPFKQWNSSFRF
ncbi:hypothetical protein, partial [Anoxybacteroides rupiense]|uniref:hypothetical protein n=1 Tax=Anoxybacteroides rupiense TaxID=311460 RepID=UPI003FA5E969